MNYEGMGLGGEDFQGVVVPEGGGRWNAWAGMEVENEGDGKRGNKGEEGKRNEGEGGVGGGDGGHYNGVGGGEEVINSSPDFSYPSPSASAPDSLVLGGRDMRCKVTVDEDYKLSVAGNERTFALDGIVKIVLEGGGERGTAQVTA